MITQQSNNIRSIFIVVFGLLAFFFQGCKSTKDTTAHSPSAKGVLHYTPGEHEKLKFYELYFSGLSSKYAGDYMRAIEQFKKCMEIWPGNAIVYFELANSYRNTHQYVNAINYAEQAVEIEPENIWYREFLAETYAEGGKYDEAINAFEELLEENPGKLDYYYDLGNLYIHTNRLDDAIDVYERLENEMGFNPELAEQLVKLYLNQKQMAKAEEKLKELMKYAGYEVRYYNLLAEIYKEQGELQKAIDLFEELKTERPDDPMIPLSLYDYYNMVNNRDKALENLRLAFANPALNIDSEVSILLNFFTASQNDASLRTESYKLLDLMVKNHPDEAKTWAIYGDFLYRDQRLEEAREKYEKAISLDNSKWAIWNQLLAIDSELNDTKALIRHSAEAMELFPSQPIAFFYNGIANLQEGHYEEAVKSLEAAADITYGNANLQMQIYASLGDAAYQAGDAKKAWMNYERALKINPKNDYVLNNYAYFLSVNGEDLEKALEMSKQTIERNPNSATYLDTYGWILYKMGEYTEAEKYLRKALDNGGDLSGEVLEHYGDVLYKLNDIDSARSFWQRALETGEGTPELKNKIKQTETP